MKLHKALLAATLSFSFVCLTWAAGAAPADDQANERIDDAINTHYASADIDLAEQTLLDIIDTCASTCSPAVVARAWMYVGIVRGSGRDDAKGAQAAFETAKATDAQVQLDELFATDLVKRVFEASPPPAAGDGEPPLVDDMHARVDDPATKASLSCSLQVTEVETQRPIPIACQSAAAVDNLVLSYRHEATTRWRQLPLQKTGDGWTGEIPCTDTERMGVVSYRVQAFDAKGQEVDALGDEQDALELLLVESTEEAPPSLPGQEPPASCRPVEKPAPKGPELGSYGDECSAAAECQGGLTCSNGRCAADVRCDSDAECFSGLCEDNVCVIPEDDCEGDGCETSRRVPGNWFGVQGGFDFAMMSGSQICGGNADEAFSCFENGDPYRGLPNNNLAGSVESGFRPATARVMISYERVLNSVLSVEGRFGYAFNGGPESRRDQGGDGSSFLPFHAEGRIKLYFTRVYAEDGRGLSGPSGFLMLGGGLAQVDPSVKVPVAECRDVSLPGDNSITQREGDCINSRNEAASLKELDAYQRLGLGFASGGLGFRYGFGRHVAAVAAVNAQLMLPSAGFTLSPSLGVMAGF